MLSTNILNSTMVPDGSAIHEKTMNRELLWFQLCRHRRHSSLSQQQQPPVPSVTAKLSWQFTVFSKVVIVPCPLQDYNSRYHWCLEHSVAPEEKPCLYHRTMSHTMVVHIRRDRIWVWPEGSGSPCPDRTRRFRRDEGGESARCQGSMGWIRLC